MFPSPWCAVSDVTRILESSWPTTPNCIPRVSKSTLWQREVGAVGSEELLPAGVGAGLTPNKCTSQAGRSPPVSPSAPGYSPPARTRRRVLVLQTPRCTTGAVQQRTSCGVRGRLQHQQGSRLLGSPSPQAKGVIWIQSVVSSNATCIFTNATNSEIGMHTYIKGENQGTLSALMFTNLPLL